MLPHQLILTLTISGEFSAIAKCLIITEWVPLVLKESERVIMRVPYMSFEAGWNSTRTGATDGRGREKITLNASLTIGKSKPTCAGSIMVGGSA